MTAAADAENSQKTAGTKNAFPQNGAFPPPEALLPHRAPMVLVTRVCAFSLAEQTLTAETEISPQSLFFDARLGGVPAYVAIEYMAQTVGCFAGLYDLAQTPPRVPAVGFVLGTRKFDAAQSVLPPGIYKIRVRALFFEDEIASFDCTLFRGNDFPENPENAENCAGTPLCTAALNAFRPRDLEKFKEQYL